MKKFELGFLAAIVILSMGCGTGVRESHALDSRPTQPSADSTPPARQKLSAASPSSADPAPAYQKQQLECRLLKPTCLMLFKSSGSSDFAEAYSFTVLGVDLTASMKYSPDQSSSTMEVTLRDPVSG